MLFLVPCSRLHLHNVLLLQLEMIWKQLSVVSSGYQIIGCKKLGVFCLSFPHHTPGISAADDPSVSQSVFTIKEKGRRRRPVNACSAYCLKCLCYCTNSPINRFQHLRGIERKLTSTIFSLFRKNLPLQYSQLRIYFTQRIFGKNLDWNYPIKLYFVRVQSVVQLF